MDFFHFCVPNTSMSFKCCINSSSILVVWYAWYINPVFHISLLEPVKTSTIPNRHQEPPLPIIVEEEEEWEVSQILDSNLKRGKLWYLVEWKGFSQDPERSTYQPTEKLNIFPEHVRGFHSLYPEKQGPISSRALLFMVLGGKRNYQT
ncbi:hypothetical protein O181_023293 [Austropuccinia psidii MF-1]|uniref:Chromo domain-containing protein n=1 Tax=Austropuccinia psidii MF-1 TaxID=1389203 RepID=A0A9Q3GX60_9BASI|nr:hypothetical protein [Austropuccinia psidii MF-1]